MYRQRRASGPVCRANGSRGMVTIVVMVFLIATVVFVLAQMLGVSSNNVIDSQRQGESHRAFFLAESGLEKARASLLSADVLTDATCSGVTSTTNALGGGNFSLTGVAPVTPCGGTGQPACTGCAVTAVGTVGIASRSLKESLSLRVVDGVTCTVTPSTPNACTNSPLSWWLDLKNPHSRDAIGVFSLAVGKQGAQSGAACANEACQLAWDNSKMTGTNAVQSMGNVVPIPAGQAYRIYQTNSTESLAQVGMLFRSSTGVPSVTGRSNYTRNGVTSVVNGAGYWDGGANNSTSNKGPSATLTGETNDGTATNSNAEVCVNPTTGQTKQNCSSWCYGGDTLVFGFAGQASALSDDIASVTLNTGGSAPQNVPMTPFISDRKFPTAGSPNNPPTDIYTSMWYARNPDYTSAVDVRTGARVTGYAGASFTGSVGKNSTSLSVTAWSGMPLTTGAVISGGNIDPGTVICSQSSGTAGQNGTYVVSASGACSPAVAQGSNYNNRPMVVTSTVLTVTAATVPNLAVGDTLFQGSSTTGTAVISSLGTGTGGVGSYNLSSAQAFGSIALRSNGVTATSALGVLAPAAGTIVSIRVPGSAGALASGVTTVTGTPSATSFVLSQRPAVPLEGATLCGGTCALFSRSGNTQFTIAKTPSGLSWSAGFVCLKGVDMEPQRVTSTSITGRRWTEVVQ
jgi:hypothetical protein